MGTGFCTDTGIFADELLQSERMHLCAGPQSRRCGALQAEAEQVLHNDTDEATGFVLLPDMKWVSPVNSMCMMAVCVLPL